jgi:hypothetical protein
MKKYLLNAFALSLLMYINSQNLNSEIKSNKETLFPKQEKIETILHQNKIVKKDIFQKTKNSRNFAFNNKTLFYLINTSKNFYQFYKEIQRTNIYKKENFQIYHTLNPNSTKIFFEFKF